MTAGAPDIQRYLDIRSAGSGVYLADGERIAFITNVTGLPQVWSMRLPEGWPDQATFADDRVGGVEASPTDPGTLVFSRDAGGNERMQLFVVAPDGSGERPLALDPDAIHSFGDFIPDGREVVFTATRRNGVDFDLYRQLLKEEEARQVTEMEGWNRVAAVSPDGRTVLVGHFRSNYDSDVLLVDLEDGSAENLTSHDGSVRNYPVDFGSDGGLFVLSDRDTDHLGAHHRSEDGEWRRFGPEGSDVDGMEVGETTAALVVNDGGRSRLFLFDPGSLQMGPEIPLPPGVIGGLRLRPDERRLAFTFSGSAHNPDVWEADLAGLSAERVTKSSTAGILRESFVEPELHQVRSFDGLEVPVWLYRPRGVAKPPVVVSVHGGPEAQEQPSFNPVYQYFLARGLAVAAPNVRGSSGYGKHFASLDDRRRRMDSVADLAEVAGWLAGRDDLQDRLAVMGGSYGGFMVLAALTSYPDLWAAGVDIVGIANFVTFLENTGAYRRKLREAEYGSLEEDRDFLEGISPINHVERIEAPLFVIHGANDPRVPVGEAEQIVESLEARDRPVQSLLFEDEGHGIVKLPNRRITYRAVAEFLIEHLGV